MCCIQQYNLSSYSYDDRRLNKSHYKTLDGPCDFSYLFIKHLITGYTKLEVRLELQIMFNLIKNIHNVKPIQEKMLYLAETVCFILKECLMSWRIVGS